MMDIVKSLPSKLVQNAKEIFKSSKPILPFAEPKECVDDLEMQQPKRGYKSIESLPTQSAMDLLQPKRKLIILPSDNSSKDNIAWSGLANGHSAANFNSCHPDEEEKTIPAVKRRNQKVSISRLLGEHLDVRSAVDEEQQPQPRYQ